MTVPETIITSDCRGEKRITSAPNREISNRLAPVPISSIAQQASPIGIGQREFFRHQFKAASRRGGLKLAYDLLNGYDGLILIDAAQRQEAPGTLYLIEPNFDDIPSELTEGGPIDPHGADTGTILRFVKGLGAWPGKVLIVGCEPAALDDFAMGLSDPVRAAVERAVQLVEETIGDLMREGKELTHEPAGG